MSGAEQREPQDNKDGIAVPPSSADGENSIRFFSKSTMF
jgi:hypothetical protein